MKGKGMAKGKKKPGSGSGGVSTNYWSGYLTDGTKVMLLVNPDGVTAVIDSPGELKGKIVRKTSLGWVL
tara:strand:- start:548 stop:754 length:207 start_codon:yes stop_codon:yes gene_type:complete